MTKQESLNQLNQYKSVLETTKDFALQASTSTEQNGGEERCIQLFNKILLAVRNQIVDGLIDPLDVDANFSEISVACTQLLALLSVEPNYEDSDFNEDNSEQGRFGDFGNLFEGFDNDFQDIFRDLGRTVRDNIPQVIKDKVAEELHRASEEIKKAEARLRNSGGADSNQAEYTEIVIEDHEQPNEDNQNTSPDSEVISMLKSQIEELKAELQATKSTVNQGSEKKSESLSNVSIKKNIESVEIE